MSFVNCECINCINNANEVCKRQYVNLDADGQCEDYVEDKEDCISRKDTIEWLKRVTVTDGITFETGFKQILTDIENMPSVQPVSALEEIKAEIIDKYISADGSLVAVAKGVLRIIDKHTSGKGSE